MENEFKMAIRYKTTKKRVPLRRKRKCNYPNCNKDADVIEAFGSMGNTDAYCNEHYEKRELKLKKGDNLK